MERTGGRDRVAFRRSRFDDMKALGGVSYEPSWDGQPEVYDKSLNRYARTFLVNDEPAAILGASPKWGGVAMAWSYIEHDYFVRNFSNTRRLITLCKSLIQWYQHNSKLYRMECLVEADSELALEFALTLGFHEETGRLKGSGPTGEDLIQMVQFWEK